MALSQELIGILRCPKSKGELLYFEEEGFLFCPTSRLKYPVENDIPVMLVEQAEELTEEQAQELLSRSPT